MKNFIFITIALVCFYSLPAQSQEAVETFPISIAVIGTSSYSDVDFVLKNLKRSSQINQLSVALSSKGLVELKGSYKGQQDAMIDEIKGLASDRFAVEVGKQKGKQTSGALSITLRKITAQTAPPS